MGELNYNPELQRAGVSAVVNAAIQTIVTQIDTLLKVAETLQAELDELRAQPVAEDD